MNFDKELVHKVSDFFLKNPPENKENEFEFDDPDIQVLVRSFAQVIHKMRSETQLYHNDIYQLSAQYFMKHFLYPRGSMTLMQFSSQNNDKPFTIPKHTEITNGVGNPEEIQKFSTIAPLEVLPCNFKLEGLDKVKKHLRISFKLSINSGEGNFSIDKLRLHISDKELQKILDLNGALASTLDYLEIGLLSGARTFRLPASVVSPLSYPSFFQNQDFNPWIAEVLDMLMNCIQAPQTMAGFEIDLKRVSKSALKRGLLIHLFVKAGPLWENLEEEDLNKFSINCVPAINYFREAAIPQSTKPWMQSYSLQPVTANKLGTQSFAVATMSFLDHDNQEYRLENIANFQENDEAKAWYLSKFGDPGSPELVVDLAYPQDKEISNSQTLKAILWCTHGQRSENLEIGSLKNIVRKLGVPMDAKNIVESSSFVPGVNIRHAMKSDKIYYQLTKMTISSYQELSQFFSYLFFFIGGDVAAVPRLLLLQSVVSLEVKTKILHNQGSPVYGEEFILGIHGFSPEKLGDFYMLGQCLSSVFSVFSHIKYFTQCVLVEQSTKEEIFRFPAMLGFKRQN